VIEVEARSELPAERADLDALAERAQWACERLGVRRASLGIMILGPEEMARINLETRGKAGPTDVLSFPIDGAEALGEHPEDLPPPELGDILICPDAALEPLETLVIHGLLHLLGYDHEVDGGEMLAVQDELVAAAGR
jgi:probable rRNA maturation factor